MPLKITGELSKEETGLIAIILVMAISTASMFGTDKNSQLATAFGVVTILLIFVFIFRYSFGKSDYLSNLREGLFKSELLYRLMPTDSHKNLLISAYEQLYFRALKEKDNDLAGALKNKMEELDKIKAIE